MMKRMLTVLAAMISAVVLQPAWIGAGLLAFGMCASNLIRIGEMK